MSRLDNKIRDALQSAISLLYPRETLLGFLNGSERLKLWVELLFLGPIAGAAGTRNYYVGLTERRVLLQPLNWWTNKPDGSLSQIPLGRISALNFKAGLLMGKLNIQYGAGVERKIMVPRMQFQNARDFVQTYSSLPKPSLTDEEIEDAIMTEASAVWGSGRCPIQPFPFKQPSPELTADRQNRYNS